MRLLCLALILLYSKAASAFTTTTVLPSSPLNSSLVNNGTVAIKPTEKPNQNCYVCYSCSRVETSQSLVCPKGMNQCIVSICLAPKMLCGRNIKLWDFFGEISQVTGNVNCSTQKSFRSHRFIVLQAKLTETSVILSCLASLEMVRKGTHDYRKRTTVNFL